jgi:hypothetical protein
MTDHFVFARIVEHFLSKLRRRQHISPGQAATCQNILNCHTPYSGAWTTPAVNAGLVIRATIVVATVTARIASKRRAGAGSRFAKMMCYRCPTITWCLPCHMT